MGSYALPEPTALSAPWHHYALVAGIAFVVYAGNLGNEFAMDDAYNVVQNERISDLRRLPEFFTSAWGGHAGGYAAQINTGYYRPMSELSLALDYALYGLSPTGYHLTNNLLHVLNSVLVFVLCLQLGLRHLPSAVAAVVFAVHPVHTEAVNLITYRTELLGTWFGLLALIAYLRMHGSRTGWAAVAVLYALGLACKETIVTLPGWIVLLELLLVSPRPRMWRVVSSTAPLALVLLGYMLLRAHLLTSSEVRFFNTEPNLVAASVMSIYATYMRLLVLPWPLTPFYDWGVLPPAASWLEAPVLIGASLALVTGLALVWNWRRRPIFALAIGWWCLGLIPFLHFVPLPVGAAERFLYFPTVAVHLGLAAMLSRCEVGRRQRTAYTSLVAVAVLFAALTGMRNLDWQNDETLLQAAIADFPRSVNAPMALGEVYCERGDIDRAHAAFHVCDERIPGFAPNIERWVHCLVVSGRPGEAEDVLSRAEAMRPDAAWPRIRKTLQVGRATAY